MALLSGVLILGRPGLNNPTAHLVFNNFNNDNENCRFIMFIFLNYKMILYLRRNTDKFSQHTVLVDMKDAWAHTELCGTER